MIKLVDEKFPGFVCKNQLQEKQSNIQQRYFYFIFGTLGLYIKQRENVLPS